MVIWLLLGLASWAVCSPHTLKALLLTSPNGSNVTKTLVSRARIHASCVEPQRLLIEATVPHLRSLALLASLATRNQIHGRWVEDRYHHHFRTNEDDIHLMIHQRYRSIYFETDFTEPRPGDREHVDIHCEDRAHRCARNRSGGYVDSMTGKFIVLVCLQIKSHS